MVVIRGATTIARDEADEIRGAVKELLEQIVQKNGLNREEVVSIVFSSTSDIHSYYPAKAAREAGFESSSLFSAQEPEIEGGLKLCIRTMLFVEKNLTPKHVYLRGAKVLRKDIAEKINVAIDGPAGSGKSTIARLLARDYKILYLDTGAMYRACAYKILKDGLHPEIEAEAEKSLENLDLDVVYEDDVQKTLLGGTDVSAFIRTPEISMAASAVSRYPFVRLRMVEKQREIASRQSCVLDGRDIGTFVLPNADFKFFLTANADIRVQRRAKEMEERGEKVDYEALKQDILRRDEQDSSRAMAPLKRADDSILVDTSFLSVEEVLQTIKRRMQEKI